MSAFWHDLSGVVSTHWGNGFFQWYFYLGILLVLLLEKRRSIRLVLGWAPLLFLAIVYNPLFSRALALVISKKQGAYMARMFTFIPLFYVCAHGAVLALSRLKDASKFLCVCLVGAAIALSGDSVYHQYWMRPATNLEKAQQDAVDVAALLRDREKPDLCVAAPKEVAVYLRQLDAELVTPYTRYANRLGRALGEEAPDPAAIMTKAGQMAVDQIVIWNREGTREAFARAGWEPIAETTNCLVYSVSGVPRLVKTFNAQRLLAARTTLDAQGNPTLSEKGYVTIRYEYDDAGTLKRVSYYDEADQPMQKENEKYASIEYIDDGEEKLLARYYDLEGNLVAEKRRKRK